MVVLRITLSGVVIIVLGLVVYRKKFKRKGVAPTKSRRVEEVSRNLVDHGNDLL